MSTPDFTVDVFQNEYLPDGAREVNAIVTVTSAGSAADGPASPAGAAEIIIVDCSGSMGMPKAKLIQARHATAAAIDVIRDGTAFAVVAGARRAWPLYPKGGGLAIADCARGRTPNTRWPACACTAGRRSGNGCNWHASSSRRARTPSGTRSCSPTARTSTNPPLSLTPRLSCCRGFQLRLPRRGDRLGRR